MIPGSPPPLLPLIKGAHALDSSSLVGCCLVILIGNCCASERPSGLHFDCLPVAPLAGAAELSAAFRPTTPSPPLLLDEGVLSRRPVGRVSSSLAPPRRPPQFHALGRMESPALHAADRRAPTCIPSALLPHDRRMAGCLRRPLHA